MHTPSPHPAHIEQTDLKPFRKALLSAERRAAPKLGQLQPFWPWSLMPQVLTCNVQATVGRILSIKESLQCLHKEYPTVVPLGRTSSLGGPSELFANWMQAGVIWKIT